MNKGRAITFLILCAIIGGVAGMLPISLVVILGIILGLLIFKKENPDDRWASTIGALIGYSIGFALSYQAFSSLVE